jgi:hypothetical protein
MYVEELGGQHGVRSSVRELRFLETQTIPEEVRETLFVHSPLARYRHGYGMGLDKFKLKPGERRDTHIGRTRWHSIVSSEVTQNLQSKMPLNMLQIVLNYMEPHSVYDSVCPRPTKMPAGGALNGPVWYNKQYDISGSLKLRLGKEMTEALVKRGREPSMSLCDALAFMVEDLPTEIPIFWDPETAQSAVSRAISEVCPITRDGHSLSETLLKTVKEWPN